MLLNANDLFLNPIRYLTQVAANHPAGSVFSVY
jgi:hypothetical protein